MRAAPDQIDRFLDGPTHDGPTIGVFLRRAREQLSAPPSQTRRDRHLSAIHAAGRREAHSRTLAHVGPAPTATEA